MKKYKAFFFWSLPGLLVLVLDQLTKALLFEQDRALIPGVIRITSTRNTGMALGLIQDNVGLVIAACAEVVGLVIWALRDVRPRGMAALGLSLIAGGVGNMIDRVALGYVRDLFELLFVDFYIFNVADVGVVVGAGLCIISLLFRPKDWRFRC